MLRQDEICALMPHAGTMCLIQELLKWDREEIICRTRSHLSLDNPLRGEGYLSAVHAVEYGAQAIGLHGGLLARDANEPFPGGLLVGLRAIKLHRARLDDTVSPLTIEARRLLADSRNLLYAFDVRLGEEPVAEGRAAIITHGGESN